MKPNRWLELSARDALEYAINYGKTPMISYKGDCWWILQDMMWTIIAYRKWEYEIINYFSCVGKWNYNFTIEFTQDWNSDYACKVQVADDFLHKYLKKSIQS